MESELTRRQFLAGAAAVALASHAGASLPASGPEQLVEFDYGAVQLTGGPLKQRGVRTLDLAKRLLDEGVHAPTVYFPTLVDEALMIEVPETESRRELDRFAEAFERALGDTPENLRAAPRNLAVGRVDEVRAARTPVLSWKDQRAAPKD